MIKMLPCQQFKRMSLVFLLIIVSFTLNNCASKKSAQKQRQPQEASGVSDDNARSKDANALTNKVHEVQKGETLSIIAKKYGVALEDLVKINNIENPDMIVVGQKLYIPEQEND